MNSDRLARGIGRWSLVALVVNTVVGSAILGLPGKTFALIGTYSVIGWLPCAFVIGLVAACFAEVGSLGDSS
jgi:basic amino acid/polyamine antiporter, APA family